MSIDLHSTMVRFIIKTVYDNLILFVLFTFHYGQIYYISPSCKFPFAPAYLHSTMVRFIIYFSFYYFLLRYIFTFHYGQIYYKKLINPFFICYFIYIPLWLDLLCRYCLVRLSQFVDLHSTMVRFIIADISSNFKFVRRFTFHYGQIYYPCNSSSALLSKSIYIPLWLDLLLRISS